MNGNGYIMARNFVLIQIIDFRRGIIRPKCEQNNGKEHLNLHRYPYSRKMVSRNLKPWPKWLDINLCFLLIFIGVDVTLCFFCAISKISLILSVVFVYTCSYDVVKKNDFKEIISLDFDVKKHLIVLETFCISHTLSDGHSFLSFLRLRKYLVL